MIDFTIKKNGKYADVSIEANGTKIDLGLMDADERRQLKSDLIQSASEIEYMFNHGSALDKSLDVAFEIASGGIS